MLIPIIDEDNFIKKIKSNNNPFYKEYYAFYSSWFGGVLTDPHLMLLPIDDHMVHRGDGIFEGMKSINRAVYLMNEHLDRLLDSANKVSMELPFDMDYVKKMVLETLRVANQKDTMIRIFISRGPGNFSVNPYDSIQPQLYIMVGLLKPPSTGNYLKGVSIGKSTIPIKSSWLARVKSCNYLPNVLMKKEAVDRGFDFVIGIDSEGMITEGPTENILIVNEDNTIIHPPLDNILKGTTMIRACELAKEKGLKTDVRSISFDDLQSAREVIITGTSLNVLPVVRFENNIIGNGKPGEVAEKLNDLMLSDIASGNRSIFY